MGGPAGLAEAARHLRRWPSSAPIIPDTLIGAKRGSPLILGVGNGEYILASDAAAIVEHTTQAIYLSDNEMAIVDSDGFRTKTIDNVAGQPRTFKQIEFSLEQIELGGFEHYMLKEIFEQPESLQHVPARPARQAARARSCSAASPTTCAS